MRPCVPVFVAVSALAVAAQPAAPIDRFFQVDGLKLHYLEWGTPGKPPLILLHGIGRDAHSFDHIVARFSRDHLVLALDLRGHGDSAWHPEGAYAVEDMVEDLEGLIEQRGFRSVVLLGNSTGGRVAQVYAGMHPDRVRALVVEDVGPERPADIAAGFARRVREEANGWATQDELVSFLQAQSRTVADDLIRAHARSATKRREDGRFVWKRDPNLVKGFVPTELWRFVRQIKAPTLYVLGGNSTIVSPATQQQLKATLPDVEVVVMPGLGHYPHLEAPQPYADLVLAFLAKRASGV